MDMTRRDMLGVMAISGLAGVALGGGIAQAATTDSAVPALVQNEAKTLKELTSALDRAPRRRNFKEVPMILTTPKQWDHEALTLLMNYKGKVKQVWDNSDLDGPWLNLMRNSLNCQIWSFHHPDFLCVSATHGLAHLAPCPGPLAKDSRSAGCVR